MAKSSSARQRTVQRREQKRRRRQLSILLIVGGVAALVVVGLILLSQQSAVSAQEVGDYSEYPQGQEEDGTPYIGDPNAPATLTEYSDFSCPHCATFSETAHQLIDTYVADGTLKIVYKPMSFVNPQTSPIASAAGLCAAQQDMFWEMHDALFGVLATNGSEAFTEKNVTDLAVQIGLGQSEFESCLTDSATRQQVRSFLAEAESLGINSTPTIMFNGELVDAQARSFSQLEQLILNAAS